MKFTPPTEPFVNKTAFKTTRDEVLAQFQVGRTVNERFKILGMVGEGGMGIVFRATDLRLNRDAALKVPLPELLEDPQIAKRFHREVALSTTLSHPNIVRVHDLHEESTANISFFSMEYLEGKTLRQELLDADCLKPDKVKEILEQMLNGLAHAHEKGMLHRDIKPENIFLCEDGTVKLMDFGIASPIRKTSRWTQLQPSGTFDYMAPELRQQKDPSPASDIYSVGVVLYEMLTGDLPGFASEPPSKIDKSIPPFWDDMVAGCMKNCKRRYQNVGELQEAIKKGKERDSTQRSFPANHQSPVTALASHQPGETLSVDLPLGGKLEMVWIPAGKFVMGSRESELGHYDDESPRHEVTLTHGFWMGKYPVTFDQYDDFCDATGRDKPEDEDWGRGNRPVIDVSWDDAVAYCEWLSKQTGKHFRLPTEAEWEYACRAGTDTALNNGKPLTPEDGFCPNLDEVAWYYKNSDSKTHPVGRKKPNAWGLYDMHGNVREWCQDWYDEDYYKHSPVTDPTGPASGDIRVNRGGGWFNYAQNCRSAYRDRDDPSIRLNSLGFRLVLEEE